MDRFHRHREHGHDDDPRRDERRGRRRAGQLFDTGELQLLILYLISETPRHGYELMKLIESELSGAYSPSPGIIYPTLTLLEEMGLAEVSADGSRKSYSITANGRKTLEENGGDVRAMLERMKSAGQHHSQNRPGPIVRAMENLKMVLRMRGATLSNEQIASVSDIIDEAAKKIERL